MEYVRTPDGKDIKVIIPISEYEDLKKKVKILEKLEEMNISPEDIMDLVLVRQTRGEDTVSLTDYLKNEN